jgi:hypothetical protein
MEPFNFCKNLEEILMEPFNKNLEGVVRQQELI